MFRYFIYIVFLVSLVGCIQDEKSSEGLIIFRNGLEEASYSNFDLESKTGLVSLRVGSYGEAYQVTKDCTNVSCDQTRFDYNGVYFDFYFIADGDWSGDLISHSKEEIDLMLHTQIREIGATVRFFENYENTNPLSFTVTTNWSDFLSGSSGHGITASSVDKNHIFIDLRFKEFEGLSVDDEVVSLDLDGTLQLDLLL